MAFKRITDLKDIELVSLIDVVFLMLIFFLLTIAISPAAKKESTEDIIPPYEKMPETNMREAVDIDKFVNTLIIQVEYDSSRSGSPFVAYFIEKDSTKETTNFSEAYGKALKDSTRWAEIPDNFGELLERHRNITSRSNSPADYRSPKIVALVEKEVHKNRKNGYVEVRAARNTKFGFINFILTECTADSINNVSFRVLCQESI